MYTPCFTPSICYWYMEVLWGGVIATVPIYINIYLVIVSCTVSVSMPWSVVHLWWEATHRAGRCGVSRLWRWVSGRSSSESGMSPLIEWPDNLQSARSTLGRVAGLSYVVFSHLIVLLDAYFFTYEHRMKLWPSNQAKCKLYLWAETCTKCNSSSSVC